MKSKYTITNMLQRVCGKAVLVLMALICTVTACDDPYEGDTFTVYDMQPASTYLSSREDCSEWVAIMKYADLYNAVNQATQYFTVFVPTNDAVQRFYQKQGVSSIQELGQEYARDLVKFHVLADTLDQQKFIESDGVLPFKTISEDELTLTYGDETAGGGLQSLYLNNEAHVIELANRVSNGFVYILEDVMTPLTQSVYERLCEPERPFQLFREAVEATGLDKRIHTIYQDTVDSNGMPITLKRNYTVVAVSDDVYRQEGINSLQDLVAKLEAGNDYTSPSNALYQYVAYHILSGAYNLGKMQAFDTDDATSKNWETLNTEALIKISLVDDAFYLNYADENSRCQFLEDGSDIQAKNGYVHQVDGYMPVAEAQPETVLFDVTNYEEIKNWIEAGNGDFEEMKFQTTHETTEGNADVSTLGLYDFSLNNPSPWRPGSSKPSWFVIYFTSKSNNDWKNAQNHDMLMLNLGTNGWISFTTPVIVKGKYKVSIQFGNAKSMDFIANATNGSNGGQMEFSIDDQNVTSAYPYTSPDVHKGGSYLFSYVVYDEIEFTSTSTHTFKLVMKDPAASTNSNYRFMIDYILFEPITNTVEE